MRNLGNLISNKNMEQKEVEIKETCLHGRHKDLGAQMSPFAGYDMPIQYKGIAEEHNAVRHEVGVFDVSHMGEVIQIGNSLSRVKLLIEIGRAHV